MNYKLINCPICNTHYIIVLHDLIGRYYRCKCENCHAHTNKFDNKTKAIRAWNMGQVEV